MKLTFTALIILLGCFPLINIAQSSCSKALYFDGSEVATLMQPINLQGDFTIEFWVKVESVADANDRLLAGPQYHLFFESGDLRLADNTDATILRTYNISFSDTWRHVAIVRQSGIMKLYIDGNSHAQLPYAWTPNMEINILGRSLFENGYFQGWVDEFRCWNLARSQSEIQTWKARRIRPGNASYSNLVAYFPFNYAKESFTRGFSNQNRWLKLSEDASIKTLWNQAAFIDSCGQFPTVQGSLGSSAASQCEAPLPLLAMIQDNESSLDLHDIEIVSNPQHGFITDERPDIVTLNIQFLVAPTSVQIGKAPLRFDKDFAFSLTFDDNPISVKDKALPIVMGGTTNTNVQHAPKYSTDGAGNDVSWHMDIAWNCADINNDDLHLGNGWSLTWQDGINIYNQGWGVNNHSYSHGLLLNRWDFFTEVLKNDNVTFGVTNALGAPIDMRHFVIPSGMMGFADPAFRFGLRSVHDQNGRIGFKARWGGYWRIDTVGDVSQLGMSRTNWDGRNANGMIMDIDNVASLAVGGERYWFNAFMHQVAPNATAFGTSYADFSTVMDTLEQRYGKSGSDRVWVAGLQEVHDYLTLKNEVIVSHSWSGNQLSISLDLNYLPRDLRFYNLSLIVDADAPISSVTGSGYSSLTYDGSGFSAKVINLDMSRVGDGLPRYYYKTLNQQGSSDNFTFIVRDRDGNASQPFTYSISDLCTAGGFLPINEDTLSKELVGPLSPRVFPQKDGFFLSQSIPALTTMTVQIFDLVGKRIYSGQIREEQGIYRLSDAASLPEGIYCYRIRNQNISPLKTSWSGKFFWQGY